MKSRFVIGCLLASIVLIYAVMSFAGWRFEPALGVSVPDIGDSFHLREESGIWTWLPFHEYPQLSLKKMSVDQATGEYVRLVRSDGSYDWKVALNFYGKVIDETGVPVSNATVAFDWNTIEVPGGTEGAVSSSDANGLFSLTDQHGKVLGVEIRKDGYYYADGPRLARYFEYANPSDPNWHEPDQSNPVIFHLRKKGEGAKLFSKSLQIPLSNRHPSERFNLTNGFIRPDGVLTMTCDTSHMLPGAQPFPWTFGLSMVEGGLVETIEQFPFLAPSSGYASSIAINEDNLDRNVWQGGVKKTYYFYLPSTNTYGRFTVTKVASLSEADIDLVYNLTPGDRVLEPAAK